MAVTANTTFTFTIALFAPATTSGLDTYVVTIYNGATGVTGSVPGWRSNFGAACNDSTVVFTGRTDTAGETMGYGIDNISVTVISEPFVYAVPLGGLALRLPGALPKAGVRLCRQGETAGRCGCNGSICDGVQADARSCVTKSGVSPAKKRRSQSCRDCFPDAFEWSTDKKARRMRTGLGL